MDTSRPGMLVLAAILLAGCASAPVEEKPAFEPRLDFVRAEARHVFALGARDQVGGLVVYLSHDEPVVRYLAHKAFLRALDCHYEGTVPGGYDPFGKKEEIAAAAKALLDWVRSRKDLEGIGREEPRPDWRKHEERQLFEAALAAARRQGRVADYDLIAEMTESQDEYVAESAIRVLREYMGEAKSAPQEAAGLAGAELRKFWRDRWIQLRWQPVPVER
jgi:hypothetical protein